MTGPASLGNDSEAQLLTVSRANAIGVSHRLFVTRVIQY